MSEEESQNIREELKSVLAFLPEDLVDSMNEEFTRLRHKFFKEEGVKMEQNRHFRRAIIEEGLESNGLENRITELLRTDEEVNLQE